MPNPHFDVQVISRSAGQSVVAAAAYRSGEVLYDERIGRTFDYSRKEDVVHAEIMTPKGTPAWVSNRALLWNKVEASEKRKDAQLARNLIAALPRELDQAQNLALVRNYIQENFIAKGMIVDYALHESDAGDGQKNPHVHILITMRPLEGDGFGKKNRDWNQKNILKGWRHAWEEQTNRHLELAGSTERVSLKSYREQGINKHPQVHLGEDAGNLEKRGIETTRGNKNRKIQHENALIEILAPQYETEMEAEGASLGEGLEIADLQPEKGQMRPASAFLGADPTLRLEAMSLELKDEHEEFSDSKDEADAKADDKEASLNAFKNEEAEPEKLAQASLEASRSIHDAALREYLESPTYRSASQQMIQNMAAKGYLERFKALSERVYRQFSNLMQETQRLKEREREDHER